MFTNVEANTPHPAVACNVEPRVAGPRNPAGHTVNQNAALVHKLLDPWHFSGIDTTGGLTKNYFQRVGVFSAAGFLNSLASVGFARLVQWS